MTLPDAGVDAGWVYLPWDSDHFGVSIGRVLTPAPGLDLGKTLRSADAAGVRCLYLLSDHDEAQVNLAERAGFKRVDVRVELALDLVSQPFPLEDAPGIRKAVESDLEPLKALASRSHRNTRFYTDGQFPTDRADALYATWIARSLQDPAQEVFVSGPPGQPDGYIAFEVSASGDGLIGLIAVDRSHQGAGLGSALVAAAIRRLAEQGVERVTVVTQGTNQAARRLYSSFGFEERGRYVWLHRWIEA